MTTTRPGPPPYPSSRALDALPVELRDFLRNIVFWGQSVEEQLAGAPAEAEGAPEQTPVDGSRFIARWTAAQAALPATGFATYDFVNDNLVLAFDDTANEAIYFTASIGDHYDGQGVVIDLWWAATSAASGNGGWTVALDKLTGADLSTASFAAEQKTDAQTLPDQALKVAMATVAIADGAAMDNLAAGDAFRLRVRRDLTVANPASGDFVLLMAEIRIQEVS